MEKLSSDVKMELMLKLPSHEILQVCQTSKTMSKICSDSRYDPLWKRKIKEGFSIEYRGETAFEKYKELYKLYKTVLFTVSLIDEDEPNRSGVIGIYDTYEKAEESVIFARIGDPFTYSQLKYGLRSGTLKIGGIIYKIEETFLSNPEISQAQKDGKDEYNNEREKLLKLYEKEVIIPRQPLDEEAEATYKNIFFDALDMIVDEANNILQNYNSRIPTRTRIDKSISNFAKNFGLNIDVISKFIYSNILMETEDEDEE